MCPVMFVTVSCFLVTLPCSHPLWQNPTLFVLANVRSVKITLSFLLSYSEVSHDHCWLSRMCFFPYTLPLSGHHWFHIEFDNWKCYTGENLSLLLSPEPQCTHNWLWSGVRCVVRCVEMNILSHSVCAPLTQPYHTEEEDLCGYVHRVLGEHFLSEMHFAPCV